jgi:hypothetical protein
MYPFTFIFGGTSKFLGVQSLTLHLGVQRNLNPQKFGCTPKNEGKGVHVPPDEKTCGHAVYDVKRHAKRSTHVTAVEASSKTKSITNFVDKKSSSVILSDGLKS